MQFDERQVGPAIDMSYGIDIDVIHTVDMINDICNYAVTRAWMVLVFCSICMVCKPCII